jgi:uncharacterized membrane protein YhiD involved in acid resistance
MVLIMSMYEFAVYRLVSHRAFYNKSFNICIAIMPFFIATIILCLQSNLVITLGTIGALAIIRFRTAIKDPVDMMYLLWAVHIGITCGCQLYEVAVLTSLAVTIFLLVFENVKFAKKPYILVFHCSDGSEEKVFSLIQKEAKTYKVKSRNCTAKGMDYVVEISVKNADTLTKELRNLELEKFSIIEYDCDDVI